ncbi:glutamate-5-semialdehyde dehydrogenase [Pacificimonas flava]|uniref:Gamma-glutamyl phosphate reductase n=2 Tax=Pacificimonas TaxID=1960290 RepID=A0A219B879_9SPHN|nr:MULTISPECIES: glutamate-5-semialdehyde dehydrogenase [Pacificimonas]MBZ6378289.1 glutamate-5-semialdehyde dehydrogenase [Pacificimonas aurantium]OWV34557.1 glutamate-5-semialdehyde dehydrogenase [Pacificimonas flava]
MTPVTLIDTLGREAREAAQKLALMTTEDKAEAVRAAAQSIRESEAEILAENQKDLDNASDLPAAMQDRLKLDPQRLAGIADAADAIAALPDPVGEVIKTWEQPNGLKFERVRVPLGVVGIIYESRPNVTADAGLLCVMAGNAAILRGGSEAVHSNRALHKAIVAGLEKVGVPGAAVQLVPTQDRAAVGAMLKASGLIDIIVPRGGKSLVARVQEEARVPVLAHLDGICHVYVDGAADPDMAEKIAVNAKMRRTGICGAMETLLIDKAAIEFAPRIIRALLDEGCEVRGDVTVNGMDERVKPAAAEDWDTEYLEPIVSAKMVDGVTGAVEHIAAHGSHHTDSIITDDQAAANRFLAQVDSAIVMHNASTQFADGGEFGFGAEIGIATGRLHARGPVALEGLTTYKTRVLGSGQARPK